MACAPLWTPHVKKWYSNAFLADFSDFTPVMDAMKKLRWIAETAAFLLISLPLALLPLRISLACGDLAGRLLYRIVASRRRTALENIAAALPWLSQQEGWKEGETTPEKIALAAFRSFGRSLAETFKLYYGFGSRLVERVEFRGMEHYEAAKNRGKGVAFITGHCGNWELMALSFGARYDKVAVVARRQDNRYLNAMIEATRNRYGNSVIYKGGAIRGMLGRFRKNEVAGILIDQAAARDEGCLAPFLGRPAWTTKMPSVIARKCGVALLPIFIHREGDRHVAEIHPEFRISDLPGEEGIADDTRRLNAFLDDYVTRYPTEWYWIHKRWKKRR